MTHQKMLEAIIKDIPPAHRDKARIWVEHALEEFYSRARSELLAGGEITLPGVGKLRAIRIPERVRISRLTGRITRHFPSSVHGSLSLFSNFRECFQLSEGITANFARS